MVTEAVRAPRSALRALVGRLRWWHVAGLATGGAVLVVLLLRNTGIFGDPLYEQGDFALNSILIDRAQRLDLLHGNYSRVGFYHPGPALLYVQAVSEALLHDAVPLFSAPIHAHVFGILVLNSTLIGVSAALLVRETGSLLAAPLLVLGVILLSDVVPGFASTSWMPQVYVWPFLLLLVSSGAVLAGRRGDVPLVALACGLLVHGHVSFLMYCGAIAVIIGAVLWRDHRRTREAPPVRALRRAAVVLGLFALPVALHTLVDWPGQLERYWDYARSDRAGGHSLGDVVRFVLERWTDGWWGWWGAIALAAVAVAVAWRPGGPRFLRVVVVLGAATTLLTVVYAARGVDDLAFTYTIYFAYTVPLLALVAAGTGLHQIAREHLPTAGDRTGRLPALAVSVALCLPSAAIVDGLENPFPGERWIPEAWDAAEAAAAGQPIVLVFDYPTWQPAAGLFQHARRQGHDICVRDFWWEVLFTERNLCSPADAEDGVVLDVRPPDGPTGPGELVVFRSPEVSIVRARSPRTSGASSG